MSGHTGAGNRPVALFVLGSGRSGTSALARVFSLCGATLPPKLLGATSENPRGYFEPRAAISLDHAILRSRGTSGYDIALRPEKVDAAHDNLAIAAIREYLAALPAAPLVVIKEPTMTALTRLWFEAARQAGFDVAAVVAVRHPMECIASLKKRTDKQYYVRASPELGGAWWLRYSLLAERDTRGERRVFVEYRNLLENWRREVDRVASALAIDLDPPGEDVMAGFLTPTLKHHHHGGPMPEVFGTDWFATVYEGLSAAARDEPWHEAELDRVFDQYQATERGFGVVFKDYQRYRRLNHLLPPIIVKLGLGALALAHRRRGTWA